MRKPLMITLLVAIAALAAALVVLFVQFRSTSSQLMETKAGELTAQSHYTDAINSIAEIQDSLNAITVGGNVESLRPGGLAAEQRLAGPDGRLVLDRISLLSASIQRTKVRIHTLESDLHRSGVKVAALERMIRNLKQTVSEKEARIAELTGRVDSLQTRVAGLQTTVQQEHETIAQREQTIEEKRRELGTIFYIIGTKKELVDAGIIVSKGGVLGVGRTITLSGHYDETRFSTIDTDAETVVHATASHVQVLSAQPTASYELKASGTGVDLHILDPKEFRKVKHLVLMTS